MKIYRAFPPFLVAVAVAVVCAATSSVQAQRTLPNQTDAITGRDINSRERQMRKIDLEREKKRDPKDILAEINEDLGRLKLLSEKLAPQAAATNQQLDYKSVGENLIEVKKRASRLRTDLAVLPPVEKSEQRLKIAEAEKRALQPELLNLTKLIDSFLYNPIFSDAGELDQQLAARASRDLEDIIFLSDKLRKVTEKQSKKESKTQ